MAANTGRTTKKYFEFWIDTAGGTLTQVPVDQVGDIGLDYDETDLTNWSDAVKGVLLDIPDFSVTIGGVMDSTATTGSWVIMSALNGFQTTPLAFDFRFGMRQTPQVTGEPCFGITGTAANGGLINNFKVNPETMRWTATLKMYPGSAAPGWATTNHS